MGEAGGGRVLVTGLTGMLGPYVGRALERSGARVRGLSRRPAPAGFPWPVEAGGIEDPAALARAVAQADTVVHLAARVHVVREAAAVAASQYRSANVDATQRLLDAARRAGVRRFILISSAKAAAEESDGPLTETMPARPVDPYGVSKLEAERLVRDWADAEGVHAPILRLPLVYGAGVRANMRHLFALVYRRVPLPFAGVRNQRSIVYAGNVADAILATLGSEAAGRELFYVSDGHDVSTPELLRAVGAALGRPARLIPVPLGALSTAGRIGDLIARALPCPLTSAALARLLGSLTVDITKLRRLTGYAPRSTMTTGLAETADWFRRSLG